MVVMAVRKDVLETLLNDSEVKAKVDAAKSWSEVFKILREEGRKRGFKTKTIKLGSGDGR